MRSTLFMCLLALSSACFAQSDRSSTDRPSPLMFGEMRAQGRGDEVLALEAQRAASYMDPRIEHWNVPLMRSRTINGRFDDLIVERPAQQPELAKGATEEALAFIERNQERPFLLYVPWSTPHTPIFRSAAFVDHSLAGYYGDVIEELDWSVGQIEPAVISDIGSTLDIFATALSLAGSEPGVEIDGLDLTATLLEGQLLAPCLLDPGQRFFEMLTVARDLEMRDLPNRFHFHWRATRL
jgi:hypothetical protein